MWLSNQANVKVKLKVKAIYSCIPHLPVADLRGGARDACPPPPPVRQNFFIFMQFSGKIRPIVSWRPPLGVAHPPLGNPRSATAYRTYVYQITVYTLTPSQEPLPVTQPWCEFIKWGLMLTRQVSLKIPRRSGVIRSSYFQLVPLHTLVEWTHIVCTKENSLHFRCSDNSWFITTHEWKMK